MKSRFVSFFLLVVAAAASAGGAELFLPLGAEHVPGTWIPVRVTAPALPGKLAAELAVIPDGGTEPVFTCRLTPRELSARAFDFVIVAPRGGSRLRFTATGENFRYQEEVGRLQSARAPFLRDAVMAAPVENAEFFRGCGSVFIPESAGRDWSAAARAALVSWVRAGGQALCASPDLYRELREFAARDNPRLAPGREQAFALAPRSPAIRFCLCGRGIFADLRGREDAMPRLREKLRRTYAPARERAHDDIRLAPGRYLAYGDWAPPPPLPARTAALWLGAWLALAAACLLFVPARTRVPSLAFLTLLAAVVFWRARPPEKFRALTFTLVDHTAPEPRAEQITLLTPAADGVEITVPWNLTRLLAPAARELAAAHLALELPSEPQAAASPAGRLVLNRELVRRGRTLLLASPARAVFAGENPLAADALYPAGGRPALTNAALDAARARITLAAAGENPPPPGRRTRLVWENAPAAGARDLGRLHCFWEDGE